MLALHITCGCTSAAHAAACLRAPAALRPPRRPRAPAANLVVRCEDKRSPKKLPGGKPSRTFKTSAQPAVPESQEAAAAASPAAAPAEPPRVTQHSLMPVRHQIRMVQEIKQAAAAQASPTSLQAKRYAQAFRRPSQSEEEFKAERKAKAAETARLSKQESKNFALSSLYKTDRGITRTPKVLLVDGYNVLLKWKVTKEQAAANDMESAREALIEALTTYSHHNKVRVVVAFDAMGGNCKITQEELRNTGLTVAYCGDQEADTFIEAQVDVFLSKGYHQVVVATSDSLHADSVRDKRGEAHQTCYVVPSSGLISDLERTLRDSASALVAANGMPRLALLGSAVKDKNAATFEKLQSLRIGGLGQPSGGGGGRGGRGKRGA